MVRVEKILVTDSTALYKFFPEAGVDYGILSFNRKTEEFNILEEAKEKMEWYKLHAFNILRRFQEEGKYEDEDFEIWY